MALIGMTLCYRACFGRCFFGLKTTHVNWNVKSINHPCSRPSLVIIASHKCSLELSHWRRGEQLTGDVNVFAFMSVDVEGARFWKANTS